jgi:two-component system chemotaxis sensor kinase CheA
MDPALLKQKAIEKGLISAAQAAEMTTQEAFQLICTAGFSTASTITDISGRGVGMDAVQDAVHALSGVLTIESQSGQGSRFIMRLPITVSIIHALIVRAGTVEMAFPLNVVVRTVDLKRSEISEESGRSVVPLDDKTIPVRTLRTALGMPLDSAADLLPAVVCDIGGKQVAFTVDSIIGQQEIFIRPLRSPLSLLRGVSGATVKGDGSVMFLADARALA